MSGTDYIQTPNLGLYKPIYDRAAETWGDLLNSNADTLDSAISTLPVPPLPSGTVPPMDGLGSAGSSTFYARADHAHPSDTTRLPLSGGTIDPGPLVVGASPYTTTNIQFNPTNPGLGHNGGAIFLNRVSGTADTDSPQINSSLTIDHSGGSALLSNVRFATVDSGNPGGGVWCVFNQGWTSQPAGSAMGFVGHYNQQIRNGIGGGARGVDAWCVVDELRSQTGLPSSQDGILQPVEIDLFANGADDLTGGLGRTHVSIVLGQDNLSGAPVQASAGISFFIMGDGSQASWKSLIVAAAPAYAALDTRGGVAPPGITDPFAAMRIAHEQIIDFDGQPGINDHTANRFLQYTTSGTPRLRYMNVSTELWSIDDLGSHRIVSNEGAWSSSNAGKQLLLTGNGNNPALGITDSSGANLWGIVNLGPSSGGLGFAAMPAYSDGTTAGNFVLGLLPTGVSVTPPLRANGGLSFGSTLAASPTDLSKHIELYGTAYGMNISNGQVNIVFNSIAQAIVTAAGLTSAAALQVGGTTGPTWTSGSTVPTSTQPVGSLYSHVGGAVGATLYVSRGGGTWAAVAGV